MDLSRHFSELFLGNKRAQVLPTLVIALLVTGLVVVPLTVRAVDARNADDAPTVSAASADQVMVDTATADRRPLDMQVIDGNVLISFRDSAASAVAFNLLASGSTDSIVASSDMDGPQFDLITGDDGKPLPLDTRLLPNGAYELFVSVSAAGGEQRTAVVFEVLNP